MRLEYQIVIALLLDLAFGDPRWFPHPVRLIGRLITALEGPARRAIPDARVAGAVTALTVILVTALATAALIGIAGQIHPLLGDAAGILVLYTTLAARDLARHSLAVYRALERFDLAEARRLVSWMVGRDTERLTETEVVRAAVESVAENTVDGIIAPLFFAALGGAGRGDGLQGGQHARFDDRLQERIATSISGGPPRRSTTRRTIFPRGLQRRS